MTNATIEPPEPVPIPTRSGRSPHQNGSGAELSSVAKAAIIKPMSCSTNSPPPAAPEPMYADAPVAVRSDLATAHRSTVGQWAEAGNHWTGAERLAMVAEVRQARTHAAADGEPLPAWVRPTTVSDDQNSPLTVSHDILPAVAIDAVWRLTNHPGTLTADWYRATIDDGLTPEQYVELVAVVATANCIDVFATAIGVPVIELPQPVAGEPDGAVVDDAAVRTHWVPTAPVRGANVGKALTAVPVAVVAWRQLSDAQYVPPEALLGDLRWSRGALDRLQVELLAARTSLLNECFYWTTSHTMLLGLSGLDNDAELVGDLSVDVVSGKPGDGGIAAGDVLTRFAEAVHRGDDELGAIRSELVEAVGEAGLVDAAAICANFNMMVRIADGTGTPLDAGTVDPSTELRSKLGLDDLTSKRVAEPST